MKSNCFDLIRLVAAGMVLFSHQFALLGMPEPHVLGATVGTIGLYVFFVISGYLVTQSWDRDPHIFRFAIRRGLRLFPGLAVSVLLTVFVLGPLVTTSTAYFSDSLTWRYLLNIPLSDQFTLPGVFSSNPFPNAVNGSLWTLKPEALMYCTVAAGWIALGKWRTFVILAAVFLGLIWFPPGHAYLRSAATLSAYFWTGALFAIYPSLLRPRTMIAAAIAAILLFHHEHLALWLLLPIGVLLISRLPQPQRYQEDWSYGTYLYAFPVQQTVAMLGVTSFAAALPISLSVTLAFAVLSWRLIERNALALKPSKEHHAEALVLRSVM